MESYMRITEIIVTWMSKAHSSRYQFLIFLMLFLSTKVALAGPKTLSIASIVPPITLQSVIGNSWNSLNYVGKAGVTLIFIGNNPHIETTEDTQNSIITAIGKAITKNQLGNRQIVTIIQDHISPNSQPDRTSVFLQKIKNLNLHYADDSVYKLFSVPPTGITLVDIDKAGFLRQVEKLPVSSEIEAAITRSISFQSMLLLGETAPDFSVLLSGNNKWRLADFRGWKKVLLLFMPDEMTCGCQNPVPSLQAKQTDLDKHDVEVLLVSSNKETTDNLINSSVTRFDFATDGNRNLHYLYYGAESQNSTDALAVLIDKNGITRDIIKGSDPANFENNIVDKIINLDTK